MKIAIIGSGYVGLVSGACFAESGVEVSCVDSDSKKIKRLRDGIIPIFEPGLEIMVKKNIEKCRLSFTTNIKEAIQDSEVIFIAVGTPAGENGNTDLKHVLEVASDIGKVIQNYCVIATKSTVPVGTAEKIRNIIQIEIDKRKIIVEFDMASNPEFLKEGAAIEDFLRPERIILGVDKNKTIEVMKRLYMPFLLNHHPILFMDIASAELTKYAANAMLATRISFINEIANLCDLLKADINQVRKGIGSDTRIGNKFIYPGSGYGGSCFPKDVKAIIKLAEDFGYDLNVIKAVEKANEYQKNVIFYKMKNYFNNNLKNKTIAIWGLSFKPKTDDIRESSAIYLIQKLVKNLAKIRAYDPEASEATKEQIGDIVYYASDPYDALKNADAMALMTEWSEFHLPDFKRMYKLMKGKVIFDGRNIYDPDELKRNGFVFYGIGRR